MEEERRNQNKIHQAKQPDGSSILFHAVMKLD